MTLLELMMATTVLGVLAAIGVTSYGRYLERMRTATAVSEISMMASRIELFIVDNRRLPDSLTEAGYGGMTDPWGHPYRFLPFVDMASRGGARKDRRLVPINSDYDLYSVGKDGQSRPPLVAPVSLDDVIRGGNGAYYGLASGF